MGMLFVEFRGFFVPPCPPPSTMLSTLGAMPQKDGRKLHGQLHSLPWHARVSMNITSEHVNKKHQKNKTPGCFF